ncbi:hypothetical protein RRG08_032422 [Elysia crispata]|uniref:VWFA domain-containing protein n=1 Tax=Elysia crispata TaxID=231223 RepID=A0AAE0XPK5_9GAST|nr:hypothetical protein RRG08_032422 [Elysia crispata]
MERRKCVCASPKTADIVFLLDASHWVTPDELLLGRDFFRSFVDAFSYDMDGVKIAIVPFGKRIGPMFHLSQIPTKDYLLMVLRYQTRGRNSEKRTSSQILRTASQRRTRTVTQTELTGLYISSRCVRDTRTDFALNLARLQLFNKKSGDRHSAPNFLVLLSASRSQNTQATESAASLLTKTDTTSYVIGPGNSRDQAKMAAIATTPNRVITVEDFQNLGAIRDKLVSPICDEIEDT